jgi:hypothetical protein
MVAWVVGVGLVPALVWVQGALAGSHPPSVRVEYVPPQLVVEARGAPLTAVLQAVGERVGFSLVDQARGLEPVTVLLRGQVDEVLRQLLRGANHVWIYGTGQRRDALIVFSVGTVTDVSSARVPRGMSGAGPSPGSDMRRSTLARDVGAAPELMGELAVEVRGEEREFGTIGRLLRAQALSGYSEATPSEAVASLAPSEPTTEAIQSLTLRAQQDVRALARALAAAEAALSLQGPAPIAPAAPPAPSPTRPKPKP